MTGRSPAVVALGGGHGLSAALTALRRITDRLTAVVTVADDGGSSGRLRDEFDSLPPGDLRMALAALCGQNHDECIELAKTTLPELPAGSSRAAVLVTALSAASEAGRDEPWLFEEAEKTARDESAPYVPDDRSGIYEALVDLRDARKEPAQKKATAEAWASFLDRTAEAAKTDELRFVYDAHRFLAARALGRPERALGMLEKSAARFPEDGNAHARLSKAYSLLGKDDRALEEGARALALLRGPRSLRAAELVADVYEKAGKRAEAAQALATALDRVKDLPLTASQRKLAASLEKRRASLGESPSPR